MKTILACVDFSDQSKDIVESASSLAAAMNAKLYILHVDSVDPVLYAGEVMALMTTSEMDRVRAESREKLANLVDLAARQGVEATPLQQEGHSVECILREAARFAPDILVLGSHGHGAVYDLLVGGTTRAVLRRVECPTLVIPNRHRRLVVVGSDARHDDGTQSEPHLP